ncbi:centromere-associated protein E isoform X8 [Sphaerodactylus townsendi]|uniref:centromere-associated protein E isoform X8 n=1 Tax=Sphaerodactylus townsendi TaxID=933632 RepID=UPI0020267E7B|nr:centromere-associated protein E isoform X8 [Sphaerodactylus townsendi]
MADEGAVRVCVRVRPLIERENTEAGDKETVVWKSEKFSISQVDGTKFFTFDRVFHAEESTSTVYKEVADPIIKSAVQGYNGTIFAYGQTASGKTYTMLGTESSPGILPMAIEDVFKTICSIPDREFLLRISYMEIHNETIKDLLCSNITKKKPLIIREDISRTIYVEDLIEEVVVSPEEVMRWLQKGEKSRHYGETKMNARSSRSHTIFRMIIESKERDSSSSNCDGAVMVSHLNLVDLAGSERASQTGTDGIRFKEGCNINRSLLTLGQVIKKLCDDQSGGFINYRDSKLTRILQNSLGGNAKTVIICTVTPVSLEETLSTLQFASTAKKMKNSPKVNEVLDDDALLKRYRREIEDLKRRLEEVSSGCHTRDEEKDQLAQLLEEKNSLQKQQEDRIRTLAKLVVPSSSFLQEEELKARKRRRVTWAPGQISHNRDLFSEDFPEKPKRFKVSMSALSEMEESAISDISECDDPCLAISAAVPEEEWIPGPEMSLIHKDFADSVILCETLAAERDCAVTKQEATLAELETLQLEKEQLSQEVKELTEKIETNEFIVLEKKTAEEHEDERKAEAESMQKLGTQNSLLQKGRDDLQQAMEEVKAENDQLRGRLRENTEKGLELREQLNNTNGSLEENNDTVELRREHSQVLKTQEGLSQTILQLKQEVVETQAEVEKLLEKTRSQEQLVIQQDNLIVEREGHLRKPEAELGEEITQLKEKVEQLAEKLSLQITEDNHLLDERKAEAASMQQLGMQNSLLQKERDDLQQAMEEVKAENDQLRGRLRENTEKVVEIQAEVEKLLEKTRSQEQLVIQQESLIVEQEGQLRKQEAELGEEMTQLKEKVEQLTERLSLQIAEANHLLDERKAEAASMQQLGMQNSLLQKERDDLQQAMEEVKAENDQLRGRLRENTEKGLELREQLNNTNGSLGENHNAVEELKCENSQSLKTQEELNQTIEQLTQKAVDTQAEVEKLLEKTRSQEQLVIQQESLIVEREEQLRKREAELGEEITQLKEKLEQLTEELSLQMAENNLSQDERKVEAASMQQLGMQNSLLQKERDSLQQAMEEVKAENDQLRGRLRENTEKGLVLQEQLNSADGSLKEYHDMVEKLRCQNSLALKTEEELNQTIEKLKQKVVDTQAEVEKLLEKTRTQEQLVIQQETLIVEREEQLRKREAELGEEMTQLKEKVVDTQAEMMKLLEKTRFQEQQATRQESLIVDREQQLRKREAELGEEITQWKEKVEQLTERLSFQMAENNHLLDERKAKVESTQQLGMQNSLLQKESDDIQQAMEEVKAENDQLRGRLRENTEKGLELQEQLNSADGSLKEYHDMVEKLRCQNSLALKTEEELNQTIEQLKQKVVDTQAEVEKLLEKTRSQEQQVIQQENLIVSQEEQLRKREAELGEEMAQLKEKFSKTNAELQKDLHELREQLAKATEEKTPEDKEREDLEILQAKVSKIEEALQKFPAIEQRYEYLGRVAWNLMTEVNSEKELVTKVLKDVSHEKAKQIRRLQMEHEIVSNGLQKLLNKTQFLSLRLCKREKEYYSSISSYTMELLGERRKQHELLTQIQSLKEPCRNSHAAVSQQLYLPELSQNLDFHVEQIWKDVSQMEEEICSIEAMLQKLENEGRKMERHSVPFDVQDFETTVKRDNERLFPVGQFLKPKPRPLIEAKEELESKNKNYCKETEASLKACRERTRELHLALNMAKEQQTPSGHADLILEDENCRLESKLRAQDQAMKDLKLTIQGLEKAANEAKQNLLEKERRIAVLEMELKVRASRSEVVRLRAVLEEKENVLTNTLTENQTLKAQLNEGAELYKEEIEDLKTQLAKADMTLIKQSKRFDWQLANAKALLEQRDEQLRRTREELRRTQLEQDTTVVHSQNVPQPPLPITCGGGSGIVQNTQMLVLQAEHAKLEREVGRLKKEHELLLKNELHLKEEVRKWKERALKMRERSRATSEEEQRLKSPRKTAPPLLTGPSSSPSKESSVQPPPALDKRPSSLNYPKTFFDNSCLGTFSDVRLTGGESKERTKPENSLKDWMEKANKEGKPECKTQ